MDEFKIGLTLLGLALGLGSLAWATLRQREELRVKSAEIMRTIFELSGQYLARVDEAEAVVRKFASHLTDPTEIQICENIRLELQIWKKLAAFNHSTPQLFLYGIEKGRVDDLLLVHQNALSGVARIRDILATPNLTQMNWAAGLARGGDHLKGK